MALKEPILGCLSPNDSDIYYMNYDFDKSIIKIADDFYEAYLRCLEGKNETSDGFNTTSYEVVNVPAIVNGAFAIELYIKGLSHLSNRELKCKKHSIKALLLTLEPSIQEDIRKEVELRLDKNQTHEECLKCIDNAFVFWRYIHTKNGFDFGLNKTLIYLGIFLCVDKTAVAKYT